MFYLYSFIRIQNQFPDLSILAASFEKGTRKFQRGILFSPNAHPRNLFSMRDILEVQLEMMENETPIIALYDGAPEVKPECKMICFTSYDSSWFLAVKDMVNVHITLYMPTWSFEELKEARNLLHLEISEDILASNFTEFGGIPRVCFIGPRIPFHEDYMDSIKQGIQKIQSFSHFIEILQNKRDPERVPHRLFKFVPRLDEFYRCYVSYEFEPISSKIECAVSEHLKAINRSERIQMLNSLEGIGKASSFYGFLFESFAHEILSKYDHFNFKSLSDSSIREIEKPSTQISFVKKESYVEYASSFLHIPLASNFPACDSWFVDQQKKLVIFIQVTSSYHHPVSYDGLKDILEKLSYKIEEIKNYEKILLFVVPESQMAKKFSKQQIVGLPLPNLSDARKRELFVNIFSRIEDELCGKKRKVLAGIGDLSFQSIVKKIGKNANEITLYDVYSHLSEYSTRVRNVLENFFRSISDKSQVENEFEQYVLGLQVQ
jgi:hypothetical protein